MTHDTVAVLSVVAVLSRELSACLPLPASDVLPSFWTLWLPPPEAVHCTVQCPALYSALQYSVQYSTVSVQRSAVWSPGRRRECSDPSGQPARGTEQDTPPATTDHSTVRKTRKQQEQASKGP